MTNGAGNFACIDPGFKHGGDHDFDDDDDGAATTGTDGRQPLSCPGRRAARSDALLEPGPISPRSLRLSRSLYAATLTRCRLSGTRE